MSRARARPWPAPRPGAAWLLLLPAVLRCGRASQSPVAASSSVGCLAGKLQVCGRRFLAAPESPAPVEDTLRVWPEGRVAEDTVPGGQVLPSHVQVSVLLVLRRPLAGAQVCTLVFFPPSVFHFHGDSVFDPLVSRAAGPSHT